MKGTCFQKPLELSLLVDGESWQQGATVHGTLVVKNHAAEPVALSGTQVRLAAGDLKKVRAKSPAAFEVLSSAGFDSSAQVAPRQEARLTWSFKTDRNCPVTDPSGSLFLLYGSGDALEKYGQLQLPFQPEPLIQEFIKTFEVGFRFVVKTIKTGKKGIEVKFAPPSAKAFATLELLVVNFFFEGENLRANYEFQVRKIEATSVHFDVKKDKKKTEQVYKPEQYRLPSGRFNHEPMEAGIREALSLVEAKLIF